MRIAILGAAGYGKTTLSTAISEELGIEFFSIPTRELMAKYGYETHAQVVADSYGNTDRYLAFHNELMLGRIEKYFQKMRAGDEFVTDRTSMCNWIYNKIHASFYAPDSTPIWERHDQVITQLKHVFTHVFVVTDPHGAASEDGLRNTNKHYNQMFTDLLLAELQRNEVSFYPVQESDHRKRVDFIRSILGK